MKFAEEIYITSKYNEKDRTQYTIHPRKIDALVTTIYQPSLKGLVNELEEKFKAGLIEFAVTNSLSTLDELRKELYSEKWRYVVPDVTKNISVYTTITTELNQDELNEAFKNFYRSRRS